jgi:multicomponent Na+:H+ antiporter subunit E
VKYQLSLGLGLGVAWLVWSGHYTNLLLSLGFGSVVIVLVICSRMRLLDREVVPVDILLRLPLFVPWLLWEILKANLDVARRIVDPRLPISPRMIRVRTGQRHDLGRVIYANSITLTPGTVSVSVQDDEIEVHALTQSAADGLASGEMNRRVTDLEGRG